jgi:glycerol-3-phosphate acyltransferase PlsY
MAYLFLFLLFILNYIVGSIPSGFLVVKYFTGKNILEHGTGNVGTMNTHRTTNNKALTLLVLILDLTKGYLSYYSVILAGLYFGASSINLFLIASFAVILGHNYSLFLKFKGGKGLATGAGFFLGFYPFFVLVWVVGFLFVVSVFKYMVLAQFMASLLVLIVAYFISFELFLIIFPMSALVLLKHGPRLRNVIDGSEPKMYYKIRSQN